MSRNVSRNALALASALALVALLGGCVGEGEVMPDASPDADGACYDLCEVEDTDIGQLPSNRCPGGNVDCCVAQCQSRMPQGDWCPAY